MIIMMEGFQVDVILHSLRELQKGIHTQKSVSINIIGVCFYSKISK